MSGFSWIGNYWRVLGKAADPQTEKYWLKLRKFIAKRSKKIGRTNDLKPEIFCMEDAQKMINRGIERDVNPSH